MTEIKDDNYEQEDCIICSTQVMFENCAIQLVCIHKKQYCKDCIDTWGKINPSCPSCRSAIPTDRIPNYDSNEYPLPPKFFIKLVDFFVKIGEYFFLDHVPKWTNYFPDIVKCLIYIAFSFIFTFGILLPIFLIFYFLQTKIGQNIIKILIIIGFGYYAIDDYQNDQLLYKPENMYDVCYDWIYL